MEGNLTQVFSAFGEAGGAVAQRAGTERNHEAVAGFSSASRRATRAASRKSTRSASTSSLQVEPAAYATAAERMLMAIGEPESIDTRNDPRLSRIFSNKVIRVYPAFREFYGMEETIEQIVAYFKHAGQALEERKQILYLLGPPGGGKSSLAEKLKQLMEEMPFYTLKGSPVNESPLGLFTPEDDGVTLEDEYGIPRRYLSPIPRPGRSSA
jgi:serine protein kinase